ncbi:hypothetical protein N657DRAFT_679614 [Parathielavia appendiculata]|uniref:Uncharacterized protein n=1 Tax=Parathielavia appendiculata TaxID=2587402 RepID=A0AAN6Z4D7_9PEZI|nr:hypothetical protein N657DRAFT_679614 [Parathielavia appendiculata]
MIHLLLALPALLGTILLAAANFLCQPADQQPRPLPNLQHARHCPGLSRQHRAIIIHYHHHLNNRLGPRPHLRWRNHRSGHGPHLRLNFRANHHHHQSNPDSAEESDESHGYVDKALVTNSRCKRPRCRCSRRNAVEIAEIDEQRERNGCKKCNRGGKKKKNEA